MNKGQFTAELATRTGLTKKESEVALNTMLELITESLVKGDDVNLIGFGKFEVRERQARKGRNPQTGEPISIPETVVPAFKAGKKLKDAVK